MNETLRLTLLGSPRLLMGDQPLTGFATNKAQALLFYLAVTGQPHSRDQLATLLWDEMTNAQAKKNLRSVLPDLRHLVGWVSAHYRFCLAVVLRSDDQKGFKLLPRRWVVERTFAWLNHARRLSKDYERLTASSEAMIQIAMIRVMLRCLAPA